MCVCVLGEARNDAWQLQQTQFCLAAFWEWFLCPKGAHLIRVNHGDTLLTAAAPRQQLPPRKEHFALSSVVLLDGTLWRQYNAWVAETDSRQLFFFFLFFKCETWPSNVKKNSHTQTHTHIGRNSLFGWCKASGGWFRVVNKVHLPSNQCKG